MSDRSTEPGRGFSRRHLLLGGAAAGAAGLGAGLAGAQLIPDAAAASGASFDPQAVVPFHGPHQAGIETPPQAHATFLALDLRPEVDAEALRRMLRVLTDDAERLTQGRPALADSEPDLALVPARLTVTFGFGPRLVALAGAPAPDWLAPLPPFRIDRLDPAYGEGDLLLQVAADDPVTVAHAIRMLLKDARSFATVRWSQPGFRRAAGTEAPGATMRNLFGQLDGTANPQPGTTEFEEAVWGVTGPAWLRGGTGFVLRRIAMDLDGWDEVDRPGRDASVGRRLDTGAPLTGEHEHDVPDLGAVNALGFPVIASFAHLRRAREAGTVIFRRGYNYDDPPIPGGPVSNAGLLFASFQAHVTRQFVPMQARLAELDMLNTWTTPVGSAVFAIPPGCQPGGYVGQSLLG